MTIQIASHIEEFDIEVTQALTTAPNYQMFEQITVLDLVGDAIIDNTHYYLIIYFNRLPVVCGWHVYCER